MSRKTTFTVWSMLVLVVMAGTTGCWSRKNSDRKFSDMFSLKRGMPWHDDDEMKTGTPVRMACTWIDTVRHQEGEPPQRGFGGRVLFYDRESNDPIKVDGALVVYAFDETDRDVLDNRPTRRYVFPPEQVELHMSRSSVGASYSFFLPWDQAGGAQTEISLICRFQPRSGSVVISEQTRHLLPGAIRPGTALAGNGPQPRAVESQPLYQRMVYEAQGGPRREVQQAGFETSEASPGRRMTTTSISLPENFRMPPATSAAPGGAAEPRSGRQTLPQSGPAAQSLVPATSAASTSAPAEGQPTQSLPHPGGPPLGRQPFVPIGKAQFGNPMTSPLASPAATMPLPAAAQQTATGQHWHAGQPVPGQAPQMVTTPPQSLGDATSGPMTTVSYLSPQDSLRWEQGQRSFGSTPLSHQAPWPPTAQ